MPIPEPVKLSIIKHAHQDFLSRKEVAFRLLEALENIEPVNPLVRPYDVDSDPYDDALYAALLERLRRIACVALDAWATLQARKADKEGNLDKRLSALAMACVLGPGGLSSMVLDADTVSLSDLPFEPDTRDLMDFFRTWTGPDSPLRRRPRRFKKRKKKDEKDQQNQQNQQEQQEQQEGAH